MDAYLGQIQLGLFPPDIFWEKNQLEPSASWTLLLHNLERLRMYPDFEQWLTDKKFCICDLHVLADYALATMNYSFCNEF